MSAAGGQSCTCKTETREPNATLATPWFPGIQRFRTTNLVEVDRDCGQHGFMLHPDFHPAADIRYGD